jgi:hypothetical protein
MAAMRRYCEVLSIADILAVVNRLADEGGMKLEVIIKGAGLTASDYASIKELADDPRISQLRDLCRASGAELCLIQSASHAPYRDIHSPTSHPNREPGLHDRHLADAK